MAISKITSDAIDATGFNLDRTGSDGEVVRISKDGTAVGSISTIASTMYLGTGDVNLRLGASTDIRPTYSTGLNRDNAIDLGTSAARFKDFYLGGGAYIGGTGSANYLDDYEEGSWTPQIIRFDGSIGASFSVSAGTAKYVKIGRLVTIKAWIVSIANGSSNGSSYWTITGLPFTGIQYSTAAKGYGSITPNGYYVGDANGQIILTSNSSPYTGSLSGTLMITLTYETNS